jgi:small subunit ribosomal protein S1
MSVMSEEMKNQVENKEAAEKPEAATPAKTAGEDESIDMGALLEKYGEAGEEIARGKVIEGTVVGKAEGGWLVDVGYKCEGFLPEREWTHHILVDDKPAPEIGEKINVQVTSKRDADEAQLTVSRWRCEFDRRWAELEEKTANNDIITVKGLRKVKGGLMVNCYNLEGFIPISHLAEEGRGVNPGRFEGQEFQVRLLEKDKRKRRLVLSRRSILDETLKANREKFYSEVNVGDILDGTVSSVTTFGLFVNVGPLDGLVHVSEISWQRSSKSRETYKKGDAVKVKVIGIDKENNRISLSIRQAQGDPWDKVSEHWQKGQETKGIVTNVTDFGAFVEVEPGIEGLIHIGDLSWSRIKHPREVVHKGQEVEVVILDIDPEKKRMSLGYKQLHDPWKGIEERYVKGQDIKVKVVRLADFGAFVELEKGVEGLIHISQLSTHRVEKPGDVLQEGQEVTARVLEVNPSERRIRLSISAIEAGEKAAERAKANAEQNEKAPHRDAPKGEKPAKARRKPEAEKAANYSEDTGVTLGDIFGGIKLQ